MDNEIGKVLAKEQALMKQRKETLLAQVLTELNLAQSVHLPATLLNVPSPFPRLAPYLPAPATR